MSATTRSARRSGCGQSSSRQSNRGARRGRVFLFLRPFCNWLNGEMGCVELRPAAEIAAGLFCCAASAENRGRPMSMEDVRISFLHAAAGQLRLDHAGLSYQGPSQVLSFTGWHADGTALPTGTAPV